MTMRLHRLTRRQALSAMSLPANAQHTSTLTSLPLLARGKVRDNYAVGDDRILMVASDRISAYDVIMTQPIPGKGALLTQMALFWHSQRRCTSPLCRPSSRVYVRRLD